LVVEGVLRQQDQVLHLMGQHLVVAVLVVLVVVVVVVAVLEVVEVIFQQAVVRGRLVEIRAAQAVARLNLKVS
jgi:hypothetical protein